MPRSDGRAAADLRPISFQRGFTRNAAGSVDLGTPRTLWIGLRFGE